MSRAALLLAGIGLALLVCIGLVAVGGFSHQDTRSVEALAIDSRRPQTAYAGTWGGGVFKTSDGGVRWHARNEGLANKNVFSLAIDPTNRATVYAGTLDGVFRSTNGGNSWRLLGLRRWPGARGLPISALVVDPERGRAIYAVDGNRGGLMMSTNAGRSWRKIEVAEALALDPAHPRTLLVGSTRSSIEGSGSVTTDYGISKSTDGGRSWGESGLAAFDVDALALAPHRPWVVYASSTGGEDLSFVGGMFRSVDGGASWRSLGGPEFTFGPNGIAISPEDPNIVYVSSLGAVMKTPDGGRTWQATLATQGVNGSFDALAIDAARPETIYAGSSDGRIFKSTDEGRTWRESELP